jgi:hypothetical protein
MASNINESKFGTKIFVQKEEQDDVNKEEPCNDDTTDDETDDEGGANIPALSAGTISNQTSAAGLSFSEESGYTVKILKKNGRIVLPSLSIRANKKNESSVIVQIGQAAFKITRVPLEFCLSRLTSEQEKDLERIGPRIGANVTTTFNNETITCLVSPHKPTTELDIPTVSVDFIRALEARLNAEDPLPKAEDYECPPAEVIKVHAGGKHDLETQEVVPEKMHKNEALHNDEKLHAETREFVDEEVENAVLNADEEKVAETHAQEVVKGTKSTGKKLSKNRQANDGWLVAASHDIKRKRVKRSHPEYSDPAVTDLCTGLVVRSETDFKVSNKFKKNSFIPGSKMHSISQIRLVSVLPQESERRKELEIVHNELEREQRAADILFENRSSNAPR